MESSRGRTGKEREEGRERGGQCLPLFQLVGDFVASSIVTPGKSKEAYKKCIWHLRIYV